MNYNGGVSTVLTNTVAMTSVTLSSGNPVSVSGTVTGNWTNNNTYFVNGNLTIPTGQTLTIQPGTQVRVNGNYTINVNGALIAQGTQVAPILFTSNMPAPTPGDWGGLRVNANGSIFKYCIIEYSFEGIWMENSNSPITYCELRHFYSYGIYFNGSFPNVSNNWIHDFKAIDASAGIVNDWNGTGTCTISCNRIHDGNGYGIRPAAGYVYNNEIYNISDPNRGRGIEISYGSPKITNNYVHDCRQGVMLGNSVNPAPNPTITNNCFINNLQGIWFTSFYANATVVNNIITGNDLGIYQSSQTTPSDISYNLVWNNTTANYKDVQIVGIGQPVATNSNGDPVDSYFNLSQDPLFSAAPFLGPGSPCINAGKSIYSSDIGFKPAASCVLINGMNENEMTTESLIVYPNPGTGKINVRTGNRNNFLVCYNAIGQKIFEKENVTEEEIVDISHLPKGVYFFNLKSGNSIARGKLILN
jgi:hypothetical protein